MPRCLVPNCPSPKGVLDGSLTFHRFPSNVAVRKKWLERCGRSEDFGTSRSSRVCSLHFSGEDFERDLKGELLNEPLKTRLKPGAEPHINLLVIKEEPEDTVPLEPILVNYYSTHRSSSESLDDSHFQDDPPNQDTTTEEFVPLEPIQNSAVVISAAQSSAASSTMHYIPSSLPASQNWPGEFEFNVSLGPQQKHTKGVSWTYSKIQDKLYVGKDVPCPINFSVNRCMPTNIFIRVMTFFSSPENAADVVQRCMNHSLDEKNKGFIEAMHLVRCESSMAAYEINSTTKHHSVIIPFENPQAGQIFSTYLFKFMCFGSCAGGPSRRPLLLVFTLEREGQVIGRRRFDLKICACPGRDRLAEEKALVETKQKTLPTKRKEPESINLPDALEFPSSINFPQPKKARRAPNADGYYTVTVKDPECYEFLKQMKKFYEICKTVKNLSPDVKKALDNYNRRKNTGHCEGDS